MPAISARASAHNAETLSSIEESHARIDSQIADMRATIVATRAYIDETRTWLRGLDRLFPAR